MAKVVDSIKTLVNTYLVYLLVHTSLLFVLGGSREKVVYSKKL